MGKFIIAIFFLGLSGRIVDGKTNTYIDVPTELQNTLKCLQQMSTKFAHMDKHLGDVDKKLNVALNY